MLPAKWRYTDWDRHSMQSGALCAHEAATRHCHGHHTASRARPQRDGRPQAHPGARAIARHPGATTALPPDATHNSDLTLRKSFASTRKGPNFRPLGQAFSGALTPPCPSTQSDTPIHLPLHSPKGIERVTVWGLRMSLLSVGNIDVRFVHDVSLEEVVDKVQVAGSVERGLASQG